MTTPMKLVCGLAVVFLLFSVFEGRQASQFQVSRDSVLAVSAQLQKEVAQKLKEADSSQIAADRTTQVAERQIREAEAILERPPVVLRIPDSTVRDSLRFWRDSAGKAQETAQVTIQALNGYRVATDSLQVALRAQEAASAVLRSALQDETARANGLELVLRKAPGCHRLLGLPVPRLGVGAALTTRGLEPAVALIVPIGSGC